MDIEALRRDEREAARAFQEAVDNGPRVLDWDSDDAACRRVRDAYDAWVRLSALLDAAEQSS